MLWPLQGTEGGCDRRVSIGTCGSDNMGSESGVITTAVFCVDDQCDIKYLGFKLCILGRLDEADGEYSQQLKAQASDDG